MTLGDKAPNLTSIAENLSQNSDVISLMSDYIEIRDEKNGLREQIEASNTIPNKAEAYEKLDAYVNDRLWFSMITTILPVAIAATGGTMVIPGIIFSAYLDVMTTAADYFWDYRVGMIHGCEPIDDVFSEDNSHGAGWIPLTRAYIEENGHVINKSGKYYFAENPWGTQLYISKSDGSEPSVDVTLCFHEETGWGPRVFNGSTLHICDCTYKELEDGTATGGGPNACVSAEGKSKIIVESGIFSDYVGGTAIRNSGGEVIINGGTIGYARSCAVRVENGGKVTVNGGNITAGVCAFDNSEIIVNNGKVTGESLAKHFSLWTNSGKITVNGGTLTSIGTDTGTVTINGGQIGDIDPPPAITNASGSVTVKDGQIGGIVNESGTVTISGGAVMYYACGIRNGPNGTVTITGGTLTATQNGLYGVENNGGTVTVRNAIISGVTNNSGGKIAINGGDIQGSVKNGKSYNGDESTIILSSTSVGGSMDNLGKATIHSGTLNGVLTNHGDVSIYGGTFKSLFINRKPGTVGLFIDKNTNIEMIGGKNGVFFADPDAADISVEAAPGYSGSVTYYSAPDASGVKMTIQEAANIDYGKPYVRLVADGAAGDPSSGEGPENCEHSYTSVVTAPTCTERGYTTYTCSKCGDSYRHNYTDALGHSFGEWVVTKLATATEAGMRERICSLCQYKETAIIPATGSSSSGSGGNSGGSSGSSDGSSSGSTSPESSNHSSSSSSSASSSGYQISTVKNTSGGSVSLSRTNAVAGQTVTVTVRPDSGYELDTLQVLDKDGKALNLRTVNGKYTFTMPDGKVTVNASFRLIEQGSANVQTPSKTYSDVANNYWAKDAIDWASSNNYMNGVTATSFSPDGTITRQQIWMILARLSGQSPANMAEAKMWAVSNGISDGTNPGNDMTRQQMVTFLYRYCKLKGYEILGDGYLTGFPDIDKASDYARDALAWAADNSIVEGTKEGLLNPTGTATRAQFAVILRRFYDHVVGV